jgi:hypothetical protein
MDRNQVDIALLMGERHRFSDDDNDNLCALFNLFLTRY